jgi:hypothetical protein
MWLEDLHSVAAEAGFVLFGAFHPDADDGVPGGAGTLALLGNAGPAMWRAFAAAVPATQRRIADHPLDRWTRATVLTIADTAGGRALFPFEGPPFLPFLRWARKAAPVHPSPMGPLIHRNYGLWHAYRAALAFESVLPLPPRRGDRPPCEDCHDEPCRPACPASAITVRGYDVARCRAHISSSAGEDCMDRGCRARRACPVGRDFRYQPDQARFHMTRFRAGQLFTAPS